ncbi:hypothetical protein [Rhodococcus sp. 14-2470-1a]|uniref:hypothetical protein n=1 Tax=Rhodococcus sp. 14-2470-1a TaxID=2023150 RepID=UPI000BCF8472|nr:hypothetical protein [Rhodococcus sp. 14-2470-1a]OZF47550.1 hypothetical protein CH292_19185 [Rhodococcus sp. 14-2470-1a]
MTAMIIETPTSVCVLPHKRIPDRDEPFTRPDGSTGVGDGSTPVWDRMVDGGRAVAASHDGSTLCRGHLTRLQDLIASTPRTVEWMREQIEPSNTAPDRSAGYTKPSKKEPPLPISAAAVDSADEELVFLCEWADQVSKDRSEIGPDLAGARTTWRSTYRPLTPLQRERRVVGFRAIDPAVVNATVNGVATYLLTRLDWIAQQEWAGEMMSELAANRGRHLRRWPLGDTARRVKGYRCLKCHRESIVVHPPAHAPQYAETVVMYEPPEHYPPGGIGPRHPLIPRPRLDNWGRPMLDADGEPMVHVTREEMYAHPMLVACSDLRCGERVDEVYWEWARLVAESGKDIRDKDIKVRAMGSTSGASIFEGNGW